MRGMNSVGLWAHRFCLLAGFVVGAALSTAATADERTSTSQPDEHIATIVRQLADRSFSKREQASHELTKLGARAKSEVAKALDSKDPEVRYRARQAYARIVEDEFKLRVAAFIADVNGQADHDLPGWDRFRKLAGSDSFARRLFVDMLQAEPELMETLTRDDKNRPISNLTIDTRCQQILFWMQNTQAGTFRQPQNLSLGTVAALMFVGSDPDVTVSPSTAMQVSNFSYQQEFQSAIVSGSRVEPLKRVLGAWILRDLGSQHAMQAIMMALRFDLKEGVEPSLALIRGGNGGPHLRQYGILGVGKLGGKQHLPDLEPLLKDEAICASQNMKVKEENKVIQTRICDVTLAVMVRLTGQQLRDYGFNRVQENTMMLYNVSSLGFIDDAQRQAALKKWDEWSKTHSSTPPAAAENAAPKGG
jgi:hypothetical protein